MKRTAKYYESTMKRTAKYYETYGKTLRNDFLKFKLFQNNNAKIKRDLKFITLSNQINYHY